MAERFGDFELLTLLSADAALESYLALPPGGGAQVVLRRMKRAHAQQPGARDAFLSDAHAAMRLQHPGVARVVAVGEVAHQPYLAQERVEGDSLDALVLRARGASPWPLPLPRALALFLPALEGLAAAHAQQPPLLHREVSPRNIYLGQSGRPVVTGFGLARTRRSAGLGITDAFLSPEQMHGRPLDAKSDVFTAALVLFELCCGRVPAQGPVGEIAARIGGFELDRAEAVHPGAAPLAEVLARALGRHEERYPDAGAFLAALRALDLPTEAPEAVALWAAGLPERPAPALPVPEAAPGTPVVSQRSVDVSAPGVSPTPPPPGPKKNRRLNVGARLAVGALALFAAARLALTFYGEAQTVEPRDDHPVPARFKTEILSVPSGVAVMVNGERTGRTPLVIDARRDHVYTLRFAGEEHTLEVVVQNSKRVEVDMEMGEVVRDDRYVPGSGPAARKDKQSKKDDPSPADQGGEQKPPAVFQATAPATFVLEKPHQVRVDDAPQLPLRAGVLQQLEPGYRSPTGVGRPAPADSYPPLRQGQKRSDVVRGLTAAQLNPSLTVPGVLRHLTLLLTRTRTGVELEAVEPGPANVRALPSWAFALAERQPVVSDSSPTLTLGGQALHASSSLVLVVERDNRFTVVGLGQRAWRVTVRPREKERAAAVVMKVTPELSQQPVQVDGAAVETRTVVLQPGESRAISGAGALWLAVPTTSGFQPGPIDVEVAAEAALDPPGTTPAR